MILISHRGKINGRMPSLENSPYFIDAAIQKKYDVEIDLRTRNGKLFLGHDEPQYEVNDEWLTERIDKLWVHCKNVELLNWIRSTSLHWFWHEEDTLTLTSLNFIWVYPGKQPIKNSIAVMPEIHNDDISQCLGICSDLIGNYK